MKLKTVGMMAGAACVISLMAGCAGAFKMDNNGFPSVAPGGLITDMRVASMVKDPMFQRGFTVVKSNVEVEATTVSYLAIVSLGDASFQTLKSKALAQAPGADTLINLEVDFRQKNVLGLINEVTTVLRATAVKTNK